LRGEQRIHIGEDESPRRILCAEENKIGLGFLTTLWNERSGSEIEIADQHINTGAYQNAQQCIPFPPLQERHDGHGQ